MVNPKHPNQPATTTPVLVLMVLGLIARISTEQGPQVGRGVSYCSEQATDANRAEKIGKSGGTFVCAGLFHSMTGEDEGNIFFPHRHLYIC